MEKQIIVELRRISNRMQMLASICEIFLLKEFPQDSDVIGAVQTLQSRLEDAEGET